jgi:protein-disulfide isomerase
MPIWHRWQQPALLIRVDFKAILFRAQNDWSQSDQARALTQFGDYANQLGLDSLKFETCVQVKTAQVGIDNDLEMGKRVGLTATPSFVINDYLVAGVLPLEAFEAIFKKLEEQRQ